MSDLQLHSLNGQQNGREGNGRFSEGNQYGKGRPKLETERSYLHAVREACDFDTWKEIVELAVKQAKRGEPKARTFLANYLIGKPNQKNVILVDTNYKGEFSKNSTSYDSFEEEGDALDKQIIEACGEGFRVGKYYFTRSELSEEKLKETME